MKETVKFLVLPWLFIWELPQNLLGLLVYIIMKGRHKIIKAEWKIIGCLLKHPKQV